MIRDVKIQLQGVTSKIYIYIFIYLFIYLFIFLRYLRLYKRLRVFASRCKRIENFKCADKCLAIIIILYIYARPQEASSTMNDLRLNDVYKALVKLHC